MIDNDLRTAILRELQAAGADRGPVNLMVIGPPLVAAGHPVERIADAVESLLRDKRIERVGSNNVRIGKNTE